MGQYSSYWLYQRYEQRGSQDPIPTYPNVYSVDGDGTMPLVIRREYDEQCGWYCIPPVYQWVNIPITEDYICGECGVDVNFRWVGTGKYTYFGNYRYDIVQEQYQKEGGEWTDTENTNYFNPISVGKKIKATMKNGDVFYQQCGSDDGTWYSNGFNDASRDSNSSVWRNYNNIYSLTGGTEVSGECKTVFSGLTPPVRTLEFGNCVYELGFRYRPCLHEGGTVHYPTPYRVPSIYDNDVFESGQRSKYFVILYEETADTYDFSNLSIRELILPENLRWIGGEEFTNNNIVSLTMPSTVETIGYLRSYDRSASGDVSSAMSMTFAGNLYLRDVNLNEGLKSIGSGCFYGCTSLERVDIPSTVEKMGYGVFVGCSHLKQIVFKGSTPPTLICDDCSGEYARFVLSANSDVYVYVPCGSKGAYAERIDDLPDEKIIEYGGDCGDIPSISSMYREFVSWRVGDTVESMRRTQISQEDTITVTGTELTDIIDSEYVYPDEIIIPEITSVANLGNLHYPTIIPPSKRLTIYGSVEAPSIAAFSTWTYFESEELVISTNGHIWHLDEIDGGCNLKTITISSGYSPNIIASFLGCQELREIHIDGNPSIGWAGSLATFAGCPLLKDIYITYTGSIISVAYDDEHISFAGSSPELKVHVPCELYDGYKNHDFWGKFNVVRDTDECEQGSYFNIVENTFSSGCIQSLYDFNLSPVYCGGSGSMKIKIKNLSKVVFEHVVCGTMGRGTYLSFYLDNVLVYNRPCSSTSSGQAGYVERYTLDNLPDDGEEHEIMITGNYAGSGRSNYFAVTYN